LPADGLDLADLKTVYHRLMEAGVPIHPANVVRKHLTQVGGGQLAQAAEPADVGALVVSDVPGDDMSVIASGPTVPDSSTYQDAMQVLYRYGLWHDVPASVREHLAAGARGRRAETPDADHSCFDATRSTLVGSNAMALEAARAAAQERGYQVRSVTTDVEGEARSVGARHVQDMLGESVNEPTCWLWGGETTVTVTGDGKGGRNQELALGAALELGGTDQDAVLLSGGTDGIDGPTDAAGAWATPATAQRARSAGRDPEEHLADNDAYSFFDALDHLLRPGPTHTNVMDVQVGLVRPT
ncbi:MAG TPA: MOFRL family protein, partial [Salinibacter sp.]|nr:MOFRL family protein [Salinibacter sp.]